MPPTFVSGLSALALLAGVASAQTPFQGLGVVPTGTSSAAYAISGDGAVVVGESVTPGGTVGFRWTAAGGMQSIGVLPGQSASSARAVSSNGSVIVGSSGTRAFRWINGTLQDLGLLAGGTSAAAYGVS